MECCICRETIINDPNNPTTIKYTSCCTEPICVECQNDLTSVTNSNLTCLACQDTIQANSLVDPVRIVQQRFNEDVDRVLNQLDLIIKPYQVAITALQSHLSSHYNNLAEIKRVLNTADCQTVISQEYHRVIKPLQTTIQDNTAVLSRLEQLQKQITRLVTVTDYVTRDGRLIQLSRRVLETIWPQPINLLIKPAWCFDHPLGATLLPADRNPLAFNKATQETITIPVKLIAEIIKTYSGLIVKEKYGGGDFTTRFTEITPGKFVATIMYKSYCFILATNGQLLTYLVNLIRFSCVKINNRYVIYQDEQGLNCAKVDLIAALEQPLVTRPVNADASRHLICGHNQIIVLTLEQDYLYYYSYYHNRVIRHDLTSQQSGYLELNNPTKAEVVSYHRGIYCTHEYASKRPPTQIKEYEVREEYYLIRSLAYSDAYIESDTKPKIYLDGSVLYFQGPNWYFCRCKNLSRAGRKSSPRWLHQRFYLRWLRYDLV